jgi:hypothetical protein
MAQDAHRRGQAAAEVETRPAPADRRRAQRRFLWGAAAVIALLMIGAVLLPKLFAPPEEKPSPEGEVYLPKGCEAAEGAKVVTLKLEGDRKCYDRVDYVLPDGSKIPFVLIPKESADDPRSFYIMVNKVSNKLFGLFMKSPESKRLLEAASAGKSWVLKGQWQEGASADDKPLPAKDHPDFPVFHVTVIEASCFAQWLNGKLPWALQWDKAAGRFEKKPRPGPCEGWNPENKLKNEVAVLREKEGPLSVGKATKDISPFGCRDMAGNGLEWTRNVFLDADLKLQDVRKADTSIVLRGASYNRSGGPFLFKDLNKPETEQFANAKDDVSFRVVLELP